jgi:predicted TIM-barrel fold metal-dependent hydrolase
MRLADSHIHLFRDGYSDSYGAAWANRDEVALYDSLRAIHDIEYSLVVGFEGHEKFAGNNAALASWAQQHRWIAPLAYSAADNPPTIASLQVNQGNSFVGISLYLMNAQVADALSAWPIETLEWLNAQRQIISINTNPETLPHLMPFIEKTVGCHILISHLGLPGAYAAPPASTEVQSRLEPLLSAARFPHVQVKLSGFYALTKPSHDYPHRSAHPFVRQLHEVYGAERLLWGSDFSPSLEHVSFAQTIDTVAQLGWNPAEKEAVMGGNLRRILKQAGGR